MATTREREILDEMLKSASLPRSGIVVNFAGTRVGTWKASSGIFLMQAEDPSFRKISKRLEKDGVYVDVPAPIRSADKAADKVYAHAIEHVPLNQAPVGVIDMALKMEGYFLINLSSTIET